MFWCKITIGGAIVGTVLTGGALGVFGSAATTTTATTGTATATGTAATGAAAGGWRLLPALGY